MFTLFLLFLLLRLTNHDLLGNTVNEVGPSSRERNDERGDDEGNGRPRAAEILAPESRPVPVPPRPAV